MRSVWVAVLVSLIVACRGDAQKGSAAGTTKAAKTSTGFDGSAAPVYTTTLPLARLESEAPDGARFALVDLLYQGSVATPGSVGSSGLGVRS
mgnify:CR=1 FL=1